MADPDPDAYYPSGREGDVQKCPQCKRLHSAADPPLCHGCAMGLTDASQVKE